MRAASAVLALVALVAAAACGGGGEPVCGDGHRDPGEECDDGNDDDTDFCLSDCTGRALSALTVKWSFNRDAVPGFAGDSCTDLGARTVSVTLRGGEETLVAEDGCSYRQVVFLDLPAGSYEAELQVVDGDGAPLIDAPIVAQVSFAGGTGEVEVGVPPESWLAPPVGTFFFRVRWGGLDCGAATPPVTEQELILSRDGEVLELVTTDGYPVDGSDTSPCQSLERQFPQSVLEVPFGHASLTVRGYDGDGGLGFADTFDVFVGAGVNNPELLFDVAPLLPPDPDAGPSADAGP